MPNKLIYRVREAIVSRTGFGGPSADIAALAALDAITDPDKADVRTALAIAMHEHISQHGCEDAYPDCENQMLDWADTALAGLRAISRDLPNLRKVPSVLQDPLGDRRGHSPAQTAADVKE